MGVKKVISLTVHWTALLVSTHSQLELGGVANCLLPKTKRRKRISQGKKEMTRVTMGPVSGPFVSTIDARLRENRFQASATNISIEREMVGRLPRNP